MKYLSHLPIMQIEPISIVIRFKKSKPIPMSDDAARHQPSAVHQHITSDSIGNDLTVTTHRRQSGKQSLAI